MNVLVAFEKSQAVCKAFRARGHRAFSCDLKPCTGGHGEWHVRGDCITLLNGGCEFQTMDGRTHVQAGAWDLLVAHPPCTYLACSGAGWLMRGGAVDERRYARALQAKDVFLKALNANAVRVCVENPKIMRILLDIPPPNQTIEPYWFGDPFYKKTCLWLKNLPPLEATSFVEPIAHWVDNGKRKTGLSGVARDAPLRAKTFLGIANAMAEQWGEVSAI